MGLVSWVTMISTQTQTSGGGGDEIPADAVLYDDNTPVLYDDNSNLLYQ